MTLDEFIHNYPRAFHMAESGTWESICARGLLSTNALLDLFEINGKRRQQILDNRRPESVTIAHPRYGEAVIRDQKPMTDAALRKCLDSPLTPTEWYRILNRRVFFWLCENRLNRLLAARTYRAKQHCVLTLDTSKLLMSYADSATLCPINSGSTIFKPQPRGMNTFLPISEYPFAEWAARRGSSNAVVELTIEYAVYDIDEFVLSVDERKETDVIEHILSSR
jgi:hypothetical protein